MVSTHKIIEISTSERDKGDMTTNETSKTTRSYDCTFCKRGFTNAQALGGHMNIHRKDKAKVKKLCEFSVAHKAYEYFPPISSEQAQFYAVLRANKSYQMCESSPNTSITHRVSDQSFLPPYGDFMGSNLSLKIGLPNSEERREKIKREEHWDMNWLGNEQVDLELRLGQNPYK